MKIISDWSIDGALQSFFISKVWPPNLLCHWKKSKLVAYSSFHSPQMWILIEFNSESHLEGLKGELAPTQGHLPSLVRASYCKPLFFATQEMLNLNFKNKSCNKIFIMFRSNQFFLQTQPWYHCRCWFTKPRIRIEPVLIIILRTESQSSL
jgi:hypothetical protein